MNPEHLLEQAEELLEAPVTGAPRQADKRRAVSAAYYALFHAVLSSAANQLIGAVHRGGPAYTLVYRSIAHNRVKAVCKEVGKPHPAAAFRAYWPAQGFSRELLRFASLFIQLIEARHTADYDPNYRVNTDEVRRFVKSSRRAIRNLERAREEDKRLFLTLLLCEPKTTA